MSNDTTTQQPLSARMEEAFGNGEPLHGWGLDSYVLSWGEDEEEVVYVITNDWDTEGLVATTDIYRVGIYSPKGYEKGEAIAHIGVRREAIIFVMDLLTGGGETSELALKAGVEL